MENLFPVTSYPDIINGNTLKSATTASLVFIVFCSVYCVLYTTAAGSFACYIPTRGRDGTVLYLYSVTHSDKTHCIHTGKHWVLQGLDLDRDIIMCSLSILAFTIFFHFISNPMLFFLL